MTNNNTLHINNTYYKIILTNHVLEQMQKRNIQPANISNSLKNYLTQKHDITDSKVMVMDNNNNTSIMIEIKNNIIRIITAINKGYCWTKKDTIRVYI